MSQESNTEVICGWREVLADQPRLKQVTVSRSDLERLLSGVEDAERYRGLLGEVDEAGFLPNRAWRAEGWSCGDCRAIDAHDEACLTGRIAAALASEEPASAPAQHEPGLRTVLMSIRDENMVAHVASARCCTEEPHHLTDCGEFDWVSVTFESSPSAPATTTALETNSTAFVTNRAPRPTVPRTATCLQPSDCRYASDGWCPRCERVSTDLLESTYTCLDTFATGGPDPDIETLRTATMALLNAYDALDRLVSPSTRLDAQFIRTVFRLANTLTGDAFHAAALDAIRKLKEARRESPAPEPRLVRSDVASEAPRTPSEPTRDAHWRRWNEAPHHYETREVLDAAYRKRGGTMRTHVVACAADGIDLYHLCTVLHLADRHANPVGLDGAPTCTRCRRRDPRHGGVDPHATNRHASSEARDTTTPGGLS